jgi:mono/diheme cytochrome c family protein
MWCGLLTLTLAAAACGGAAPTPERADAAPSTAASTPAASSAPNTVDMAKLFPPGDGRDLVLSSCQNCHTFVPIVILQLDQSGWRRSSLEHRERVATLTDDQFKQVYAYLTENFGPHRPVPELPPDLLKSWTTY